MQLMRRRVGQVIRIQPAHGVDPSTPIGELFGTPIGIILLQSREGEARFAVFGDERMLVIEEEIMNDDRDDSAAG